VTFSYSTVIPAFNAAVTIPEAIGSILRQTVPPQEIIVVDDGSTDDTARVAGAMGGPITILRQENRGPGAATTTGFRRVTTPFVATLDADDLWLPQKVARQAACFDDDPAVAGVFTLARMFADGETPDPEGSGALRRLWTRTTLMFRTEAAKEIGDFVDLPGRLGEVIDWIARSRDLGHRHVMVEEVLAMRRIRPGSLSHGRDAERSRGYLVAIHEAIERKKRAAAKKEAGSGSP
jgi:glycosyltransferase involved in cell wall biosynthesis